MNPSQPGRRARAARALPVGHKLAALAIFCAGLAWMSAPAALAAMVLACLLLYGAAGVPARRLRRPLAGLAVMAAAILAFHFAAGSFALGLRSALVLAGGILAANLVTETTRVTDMMDTFERWLAPLSRLGLDPARISAMLAMTIRFIPFLSNELHTMQQARFARGARPHSVMLAVPLVISALRSGDELAAALDARGFGGAADHNLDKGALS